MLPQDNEVNAGHPEMSSVVNALPLQSSVVSSSLETANDLRFLVLPVIERLVNGVPLREILSLSARVYAPIVIVVPEITFLPEDVKYSSFKASPLFRFIEVRGLP